MMWTPRCFLKSFPGVLGDVLILYRIAVRPYLLFRVVYVKGRHVLPLSTWGGVNFGVHSAADRLVEEDAVLGKELENCIQC